MIARLPNRLWLASLKVVEIRWMGGLDGQKTEGHLMKTPHYLYMAYDVICLMACLSLIYPSIIINCLICLIPNISDIIYRVYMYSLSVVNFYLGANYTWTVPSYWLTFSYILQYYTVRGLAQCYREWMWNWLRGFVFAGCTRPQYHGRKALGSIYITHASPSSP